MKRVKEFTVIRVKQLTRYWFSINLVSVVVN